jgi:glutaredoxin-like protein NrdH
MITIYKKKNCPQCTATAREMDRLGIAYSVVDLDTDNDAIDYVQRLGYRSAPVVVTTTDSWSGFRPDKIKGLAK